MSTCNWLDLESLGCWPTIYAQKLLGQCSSPCQGAVIGPSARHVDYRKNSSNVFMGMQTYDRGELTISYKWTGWVWEIACWSLGFCVCLFISLFWDRRSTSQHQSTRGSWPPGKFSCQVERRFHRHESNRQPLPWNLGISPPSSSNLLESSQTISLTNNRLKFKIVGKLSIILEEFDKENLKDVHM